MVNFDESLDQLRKVVTAIHPLAPAEWDDLAVIWQPLSARRKMVLTATGDTERSLYFVTAGVQRAFYSGDDGKEATIVFTYPFSFSGVIDSFLLQQPSKYFLETLTASEFLKTSHAQIKELMNRYHNFEKFILRATSLSLSGIMERQVELQCFTAEQRFTALLKRSPHVLNLIPHKYLASYLGIDATNFSKLLGSVRI